MRAFILLSVICSTLPVMLLNLSPKAGEDVLAIFGEDVVAADVEAQARHIGLDVISYDETFHHLIVRDVEGQSTRALYALGARTVVDAGYAQMCRTPPPSIS
ncbi:hypothetical protein [Ponticaulis sp.]|uniref:hypothetical protein n=1 Tax=Ponticaulis sp. TaxID=2020902 RepID=UPI000B6858DB|nr:hypothetical protein [Ponticaulis sp.]MAI89224.1 hypothetical protein [Ponticaulis sp.]OUY01217.1 MAG: hypothetical protein CBB65_01905 [Hyphomonadaceae bacterium TMED5]|tara:strand:- start:45130 stop:45435 length:306 start_codon:yes stop_codon:yes gene_type:complete